jgi:hypothetical protein
MKTVKSENGWSVLIAEWGEHLAKVRAEENLPEPSYDDPIYSQVEECSRWSVQGRKRASLIV